MPHLLSEIALSFNLTRNGNPDVDSVYRALLSQGNKRSFILLQSQYAVFESVTEEINNTRDRLLSEYVISDFKVGGTVPIDRKPYVYFLFQGDVLVYVGQTVQIASRVSKHKEEKLFDGIFYTEVDRDKMLLIESVNIYHYKPIMNRSILSELEFFTLVLNNCAFE